MKTRCWSVRMLLGVFLAGAAMAEDKAFNAADGGWGEAANWTPAGVPAVGDAVTVPSGKTCRIGPDVTTAFVQTTVSAGGALLVEGGTLATSDNDAAKKSLVVNGRFALTSGSVVVHDFTIAATGRAELPGGALTVHNNMYNNAATTETTGLHIGQDVVLAKGYWNFNAPGGAIADMRRALTEIRVPTGNRTKASLLVTNSVLTVDTLGVAYHLSSRSDLTGRVDIVRSDVALKALKISDSHITGANLREVCVGDGATLGLVNSVGWSQAASERLHVQVGGPGCADAKLVVTNTSGQFKSITLGLNTKLTVATGGTVSASKVYVRQGAELRVDGGSLPVPVDCAMGGVVAVDGGAVTGVVTCAGGGRVEMNGGTLSTAQLFSGSEDVAAEAVYRFDGGAQLYLQDVVVGGSTVASHAAKESVITPTTMEFRDCALRCYDTYCYLLVGAQSTKNRARVVFDGCQMDPADGNYKWYLRTSTNNVSEVVVKGAANNLYFQQLEGNAFRLEYVFDGSAAHVAPIHLERTNHPEAVGPAGNLYLTVAGGAMLTAHASFDLLTSATAMNLAQKNFASTPWSRGDSPWTGALANGGRAYRVSLDPTATAAPGSGAHALEAPKAAGALSIPVGATAGLETLEVRLGVVGGEDVVYSFPASAVTPNATNYFVWDFDGAKTVSSVRVTAKSAAEKFYLHYL